jgi:hypothetical protein
VSPLRLMEKLAEWPIEKWMGLPIAAMLVGGCIAGVADCISPGNWPPWW